MHAPLLPPAVDRPAGPTVESRAEANMANEHMRGRRCRADGRGHRAGGADRRAAGHAGRTWRRRRWTRAPSASAPAWRSWWRRASSTTATQGGRAEPARHLHRARRGEGRRLRHRGRHRERGAEEAHLPGPGRRGPPGGVLATNTSSIPITRIAAATKRPEAVIGMHFMNPVPVMQLVELIRGAATSRRDLRSDPRAGREDGQDHGRSPRTTRASSSTASSSRCSTRPASR